jgi:hypothetical protein
MVGGRRSTGRGRGLAGFLPLRDTDEPFGVCTRVSALGKPCVRVCVCVLFGPGIGWWAGTLGCAEGHPRRGHCRS